VTSASSSTRAPLPLVPNRSAAVTRSPDQQSRKEQTHLRKQHHDGDSEQQHEKERPTQNISSTR
jgi:hypothetical protein